MVVPNQHSFSYLFSHHHILRIARGVLGKYTTDPAFSFHVMSELEGPGGVLWDLGGKHESCTHCDPTQSVHQR